jgi:hypothetical protein
MYNQRSNLTKYNNKKFERVNKLYELTEQYVYLWNKIYKWPEHKIVWSNYINWRNKYVYLRNKFYKL